MQSAIDVENLENEIRCLSADSSDGPDGNQWEATSSLKQNNGFAVLNII